MVAKSKTRFRKSDDKPLYEYESKESVEQAVAEFEEKYKCKGEKVLRKGKWSVRMGITLPAKYKCDCQDRKGGPKSLYISGFLARKKADKDQKQKKADRDEEKNSELRLRVYKCPDYEGEGLDFFAYHITEETNGREDVFFDPNDIFGGREIPEGIDFPKDITISAKRLSAYEKLLADAEIARAAKVKAIAAAKAKIAEAAKEARQASTNNESAARPKPFEHLEQSKYAKQLGTGQPEDQSISSYVVPGLFVGGLLAAARFVPQLFVPGIVVGGIYLAAKYLNEDGKSPKHK